MSLHAFSAPGAKTPVCDRAKTRQERQNGTLEQPPEARDHVADDSSSGDEYDDVSGLAAVHDHLFTLCLAWANAPECPQQDPSGITCVYSKMAT
jgi:hypothetical protein